MVKRKVCVVTGSRAEYGLLRFLMQAIRQSPSLDLQVVVTGMHLSPEFGLTYREIESDGFSICRRIEILLSSDTPVGTGKAVGLGVIGFADAFSELRPDVVVVLGDRFEILAAVTAALFAQIPVAHLHGGESTEGAFDEGIRHAITKMSHLHFVATAEYHQRVLQLGEDPARVFLVGGLGVDAIRQTDLMSRGDLEDSLSFRFGRRNLLITWHPPTLGHATAELQFAELLAALEEMTEIHCIFTKPNADAGSRALFAMIDEFVARHSERSVASVSLGQQRYWSVMNEVDAVVGNSSSGLLEAPTFRIGTINIGDRQKGRVMGESVIQCDPDRNAINKAILELYSADFQNALQTVQNPYGNGGAAASIAHTLEVTPLGPPVICKHFFDLPRR